MNFVCKFLLAAFVTLFLIDQSSAQDFGAFCSKVTAANVPTFMKCLMDFVPANLLGFMMECQQQVRPGEITEFVVAACADKSLLDQWTQCQGAKIGTAQMSSEDMMSMEKLVGCVMAM